VQGRRQKNFQGEGGQRKKIPKNSKKVQKIALLSLFQGGGGGGKGKKKKKKKKKTKGTIYENPGGLTTPLHPAADAHE